VFDKALANPNYIPVYMKVYYLFTLCLFKVENSPMDNSEKVGFRSRLCFPPIFP
jgi:hypothetical protein